MAEARRPGAPLRRALAAALLLAGAAASACPICVGQGQTSIATQLVAAPQTVLAATTSDPGRFRVVQVIKGAAPGEGTVEAGVPRTGPATGVLAEQGSTLLLVRDEALPTWSVLGPIAATHTDWLRALAAGKAAAERSPQDWRARVALTLPYLDDAQPLASRLAFAELRAAPYSALRAAKPQLDAAAMRRCLADPALAERQSLCQLLLGIGGNAQDAAALQRRLQLAWQNGDATNLSAMLAADLELGGTARVAWVEANYLADPKRTSPEIHAALLALSVHGHADGTIPRERVIRAYRVFMKAHPQHAGDVAPDFAAWQYWDAVPEYRALMKSGVRQQYPSMLAMLNYLRLSPDGASAASEPKMRRAP